MNLNGEEYFYVYNLQGDVVGLLDSSGQEVVTYQYDTWGKAVSITGTKASTVGEKNPYRYRGYRYDSETKLYYLNARYYNPEWGRFLNADTFRGLTGDLLSHNAFAYAKNNPVMYVDPTGYFWKSIVKKVKKAVKKTVDVLILDDLKTLADGKLDGNDVIAVMNLTPWGKAVKVAGLAVKAGIGIKAAMASSTAMSSMGIVGKVSKRTGNVKNTSHTVYTLNDPITSEVRYVGRTKNVDARKAAHKNTEDKSDLVFTPVKQGLTYPQARGIEHTLFRNNGGKENLLNKINPISPINPRKSFYLDEGNKVLR
jgi:RHS repeat-associated protein